MGESVMANSTVEIEDVQAIPLVELNPGRVDRFTADTIWPVFERLRREDPVHFTPESEFGPYWSVTRWADVTAVDTNNKVFSSARGIGLPNLAAEQEQMKMAQAAGRPVARGEAATDNSFIGMDEPEHRVHRKAVSPAMAPPNIAKMASLVRERASAILDSLPIGEPFDWVDLVSKELTTMTLATLFDFPFEERRKLPYWTDMIINQPGYGPVKSWEQRDQALVECVTAFQKLWDERIDSEPAGDLISMLAHNPATREMSRQQYRSTVGLLLIGGNDTTRNTISGSIYALNRHPDQYAKLRANPDLILSMVSETLRWHTPISYMSRVTTRDIELGGKTIRQGERVVMWYISANRDDAVIENPNDFIIDRKRARNHLAFGTGVHHCVGNRVAEMQLTIIWEEIFKRFPEIKLIGDPVRTHSSFVHGFDNMQVVIPSRL
ncbi:cytochrome P450 [Sphingomonas oligophenolica]|uniref:Cytochrome P450 n=1 Tax=Sphingomonas oligophenolica TaxID=301154 RepID=A0ABU9YB67_9SPHN